MSDKDIDAVSGVETTGHQWDGIKELNNPLPRWWVWTFYATILFSVGYMIYYPSIPLVEGSTMGISGYTNRAALRDEMAAAQAAKADRMASLAEQDIEAIKADDNLYRFAVSGGASLFKVNCSQCHGSGAQGGGGYPNLNDDSWLWGGDLESIYTTIAHGIRNEEDPDARFSQMPAFGADGILESDQIAEVTEYVLQISGQDHDAALASQGAQVYADNCAACHGEDGKGMTEVGAPNLTDAISLFGNDRETITAQINRPRQGVMPPWGARLGDAGVKQLALYVHSLGGGQ